MIDEMSKDTEESSKIIEELKSQNVQLEKKLDTIMKSNEKIKKKLMVNNINHREPKNSSQC